MEISLRFVKVLLTLTTDGIDTHLIIAHLIVFQTVDHIAKAVVEVKLSTFLVLIVTILIRRHREIPDRVALPTVKAKIVERTPHLIPNIISPIMTPRIVIILDFMRTVASTTFKTTKHVVRELLAWCVLGLSRITRAAFLRRKNPPLRLDTFGSVLTGNGLEGIAVKFGIRIVWCSCRRIDHVIKKGVLLTLMVSSYRIANGRKTQVVPQPVRKIFRRKRVLRTVIGVVIHSSINVEFIKCLRTFSRIVRLFKLRQGAVTWKHGPIRRHVNSC